MSAALDESGFIHPAYMWKPPRHHSLLSMVEGICDLLGERLEPEQALAIDVLTGQRADGKPASLAAAVICARQNLKTFILERIILTILLDPRTDVRLIVWTSQQLTTCDETFERFIDWFEGEDADGALKYPDIADFLIKIDRGKGTKQISVRVGSGSRRGRGTRRRRAARSAGRRR